MSSMYPPAWTLDPWSKATATATPWAFQSIDLPPDPEEKPWSTYCTVIDITSGQAGPHTTNPRLNTYALGLNNRGDVVGYYADPTTEKQHAFRRSREGQIDIFDVKDATLEPGQSVENTWASGINDDNYIVGGYDIKDVNKDTPITRAFICWFRTGRTPGEKDFITWKVPERLGASSMSFAKINNLFQIVGSYTFPDSKTYSFPDFKTYGFILRGGTPNRTGDLTWFNHTKQTALESPPFPDNPPGFYAFLEPFGMNDAGDIVGTTNAVDTTPPDPDGGEGFLIPSIEVEKNLQYYIPLVAPPVFVLARATPFPRFETYPSLFTTAHGINAGGHVVGFYSTTTKSPTEDGDFHGFIASRNYPQLLPIDYRIYKNAFQPNPRADEIRLHDINDYQTIVGTFRVGNKTKGFLLNPFSLPFSLARPVDEIIMNQMTSEMLAVIGSLPSTSAWSQMAWLGTGNAAPLSDRARDAINALLLSENATRIRSSKERTQLRKVALEAAQTKVKELLRDVKRK